MEPSIVLCGFMGSGKTTVGKQLAQMSNRQFVDLDQYIEQKQGQSVSDIFRSAGEPGFRQMETAAARDLSGSGNLVIATGGGTVLKAENIDLLCKNGVIVLLDVPLSTLETRLAQATDRPLLQREDKSEFMHRLYEERMPFYRSAAQICVDADGDPQKISECILQKIKIYFSQKA
ncbi:shikimate kinase [Clostridium minihomine]|uniref:shikimate kinase n=1 Tax=Clostridium minihomine TaxID=2045012 RepID=UPI000C775511|nr:shikimate kinase [Clostridium minihomine]